MKTPIEKPQHPLADEVHNLRVQLDYQGYHVTQGKNMMANCLVVRNIHDPKKGNLIRSIIKKASNGRHVYITSVIGTTFVFAIEASRRAEHKDPDPVTHDGLEAERLKHEDYNGLEGVEHVKPIDESFDFDGFSNA